MSRAKLSNKVFKLHFTLSQAQVEHKFKSDLIVTFKFGLLISRMSSNLLTFSVDFVT
jgi:hypothetical protein